MSTPASPQEQQNLTQIQQQIQTLQEHLAQVKAAAIEKEKAKQAALLAPVLQQDHLKRCATDQHTPTDFRTYLVHFACGHVTVFGNGTVLRKFVLVASDYNGTGKPFPITKNATDPVIWHGWMFNGSIPGPTIRVTEGDHVQITLVNSKQSVFVHSLHMHSVHPGLVDGVPDASGMSGMVYPGQNFTYSFIAQPAGLYPYHCHMNPVQEHINRGLYGAFIIDPKTARPAAAEMVMMLNSYSFSYQGVNGSGHLTPTIPGTAQQIRQNLSQVEENSDEANGPDNQFYTVNGMVFGYTGKDEIPLITGVPYRIYLLNMFEFDPVNSFHIHGTLGNYTSMGTAGSPHTATDLVLLQQGDRGIFEFKYKYPGEFMFHSHINHFSDLGWVGFFNVTLPADKESAGFIDAQPGLKLAQQSEPVGVNITK
jgi:hypothetical protein